VKGKRGGVTYSCNLIVVDSVVVVVAVVKNTHGTYLAAIM
jgi:hypothetical protein